MSTRSPRSIAAALALTGLILLGATPAASACRTPGRARVPPHRRGSRNRCPSPVLVSVTQTSADLSQAMRPEPRLAFTPRGNAAGAPVIHVDDAVRYQTFLGVGGAMTDTSAWLIWDELPPPARSALLGALFSSDGAHLSFLRLPMGASDFTALEAPYTYDDQPAGQADPGLADFSIAHDEPYVLPALRAAQALNPDLYVEAMPWSPPAWMKANDALDDVRHAGSLLPQFYPALAQYFVRFLSAYAAQRVAVAAIAPANEPGVPTTYPGLDLSQQEQATFIADYLRPALSAAHLSPAVFGWDLSWGPLGTSDALLQAARAGVSGLAWHCYYGSPGFMTGVHYAAPGSQQLVDECTTGPGGAGTNWPTPELLIASLRNWANGVALWNLALDPAGGPVQAPNTGCAGCTGIATVDEQTGTFTLSRDYYELAQLSRFVAPGARRIRSGHLVSYQLTPAYTTAVSGGVDDVAFRNPDGIDVVMAYNTGTAPATIALKWRGAYIDWTIPPGATTTFRWR